MQRCIRILAACAITLVLACVAFAQSGTSYLEGNVKGVDGKPLQGAVIKLERTDGQAKYELKTDKKGHWAQAGIALGGVFTVTVSVDGKVADTKHNVKPRTDGGAIDFDLSKTKAKA
jgi:hypothetical protein